MHAIEKILAKAAGLEAVRTGEIITVKVDFAGINDIYPQTMYSFYDMQGEKVWDKDKLAFMFDHYAPASTIKAANIHTEMREFARKNELSHHFDISSGVCHQILPEAGLVYPGMVLFVTDSHTTTHGAFGAFATGVGATDMASIMISGEIWVRVPEIIEIRIDGRAQRGVMPKDVVLKVLGKLKADGAVYKAICFTGSYIDDLDVSGRMVICNMAVEIGAKTAYMQPNKSVIDYVDAHVSHPYEIQHTDDGYVYSESFCFDISDMPPQIAAPHSVDNVYDIGEYEGVKVHQCFIGACTGGRDEDIAAAADILRGKKIAAGVRLIIIPASAQVMRRCMENGTLGDLIDAGATIATPGCGPCLSFHEGVLGDNEVCITASNRNFPGRMGSSKAEIYLASPAAVAAAALKGVIADPAKLL